MTCRKFEAMAIYLVKQACSNDILASVYIFVEWNYLNKISESKSTLYSLCGRRLRFLVASVRSILLSSTVSSRSKVELGRGLRKKNA